MLKTHTLLTWTGNVSTAWEDVGNREPAGLPGSNTEVNIPSGKPRYPVVNANTAEKRIICAPGASVQLGDGVVLTVLQKKTGKATRFMSGLSCSKALDYFTNRSVFTSPSWKTVTM